MSDNVKHFMPKEFSPHAIVSQLQNEVSDIEELYVVVKNKTGDYHEIISGETGGLSFAIAVLQKYLLERL